MSHTRGIASKFQVLSLSLTSHILHFLGPQILVMNTLYFRLEEVLDTARDILDEIPDATPSNTPRTQTHLSNISDVLQALLTDARQKRITLLPDPRVSNSPEPPTPSPDRSPTPPPPPEETPVCLIQLFIFSSLTYFDRPLMMHTRDLYVLPICRCYLFSSNHDRALKKKPMP